jgi:hypothetical protein
MAITREKFIEAVGREPRHDDLERCNCHDCGIGHTACGWNDEADLPVFLTPEVWHERNRKLVERLRSQN